ncbi:MAG: Uncharacterised protein [Owenweeksia sp. TMED14]|nr:MAG: Uncharacterised protein [Owenweeksia sp. TMED14]
MRNLISSTVLSLFSLTAFAQGPAQMAYGLGVTYFMADKGSSFGSWGSNEGGYDGFNLSSNLNFDMPIWDSYYVRLGSDANYFSALTTGGSTNLAGISPHFGLGRVIAIENGQLRCGLTMGVSLIKTWEKDAIGSNTVNGGLLGGSVGIPAGISIRYEIPNNERTYYIGADYRYFMFDDGLDGVGVGNRIGYDDQMLTFSIGVVNNKKYRSKKLASLESEAAKSRAIPNLQEKLNQAKEDNTMIKDELEVAHSKVAEVNRQLDSLELVELVSFQAQEQINEAQKALKSKEVSLPPSSSGSYVVVLGSFESKSLAANYVTSRDYDLPVKMIKASNDFYRVFLGPFNSFTRAKEVLNEVSGRAWISMKN